MKKHSVTQLLRLVPMRFKKGDTVIDVRFEEDSENGWFVPGNDWSDALRDLQEPITLHQLLSDGWSKV